MKNLPVRRVLLLAFLMTTAGCSAFYYVYKLQPTTQVPAQLPPKSWQVEHEIVIAPRGIVVRVTNNGAEPIRVLWDECAFIDEQGFSRRVFTGAARRITAQLSQTPTTVAPGTRMEEVLIPAHKITDDAILTLFPADPLDEAFSYPGRTANGFVGKEYGFFLVLDRGGEKHRVLERFQIIDVAKKLGRP